MPKPKLYIVFILSFFILSFKGIGQNPVYKTINTAIGLPNNTVYDIKQDKKGYIWLSTDKGLTRYDGVFFKNYPIANAKSLSLSNILEGPDGNIYCQDFIGNNYVASNDSLQIIESLSYTKVYTVSYFIGNKLCKVAFSKGLIVYDVTTKKTETFEIAENFTLGRAPTADKENFYFNSAKGIYKYNGKKLTLIQNFINHSSSFLIKTNDNFFGVEKGNENNVYTFKNEQAYIIKSILPNKAIQNIITIENEIWVCTTTGNYCYDENFKPKYNGKCFFEDKNCSKVYKDREDNYWFTTLNEGVLLCQSLDVNLIASNYKINTLFTSKNSILLGTYNNEVLDFNTTTNKTSLLFKSTINKEIINLNYNPANNNILIGSDKLYVVKDNAILNQFDGSHKSIAIINNDLCALATSEGIVIRYIANPKATIPFKSIYTENNNMWYISTLGVRARSVAFNGANNLIYYTTAEGTFYTSKDTIVEIKDENKSIIGMQVLVENDKVFVSSLNTGIYIIANNEVKQHLTINEGLMDNNIFKMFLYKNDLWLLSEKGVQKYNTTTKLSTIYNSGDGLPNEEIKDISVNDSILFLATNVGLISFNYKANMQTTLPPLLALNNFFVNNISTQYNDNITLKESAIDIDFSVLAFKTNNDLVIEYKINNGEWLKISSKSRTLNLPSLAPGSYTLTIRAINDNNVITDKPLILKFTIKAPFYKTWWFLLLSAALLILLIYAYFQSKIKTARKTNSLLQEKLNLEKELHHSTLTSIKSQMNPHFIFNALNTIQSYIYTNEKENASLYLGKFSDLTRIILDMSNKDAVPIAEELKAINLYLELEKLRFEDAISYAVTVDKALDIEHTYLPSMLIQPYIENAIKHGLMHQKNNPSVTVAFRKNNSQLEVIIDDNGIGRKKSAEKNALKNKNHESFALNANKKRLDLLNKSFGSNISFSIIDKQNESGEPLGTTVVINLPLNTKF